MRYHAPLDRVKLAKNWDGPFTITKLVSETTVIMKGKDGKCRKSNVRRLKHYTEQMSRNVGPSSWLDTHVGDGPATEEAAPGTINVADQKRMPNVQITMVEARHPKYHRPNKGRRRRVMTEKVTDMSSVNSAHSSDASLREPAPVGQVLDASLEQLLVHRSRCIALQNK